MELSKDVYLIGFMGAGKSTVARKLARKAGVASLDMDKYITRNVDKSISAIFAEDGEGHFRDIEASTLEEIAQMDDHMIVSCGGGIIETEKSREILKRPENMVVHLQISADEARKRIADISSRPLFNDLEAARKLAQRRLPLYEEVADITVSTQGKNVWEIACEIAEALRERGILCR